MLLGALVGVGAWLGIRGGMAKNELEDLAGLETRLTAAISDGDAAALRSVVDDARTRAAHAAELTSDPLWRATEVLPVVGGNTAAVRVVAESLRDIAAAAAEVLAVATPSAEQAGAVDLSVVTAVAAPMDQLAAVVARTHGALRAIDAADLVAPLGAATSKLQAALTAAAPDVSDAATVAHVLPGLLGADGQRRLLFMVQNSAEVRTGGGITGSFIAVEAVDGRLRVSAHVDSHDFDRRAESIAPLPPELTALYGDAPGRFVMNATMTPDFALSAQLATAWWQSLGYAAPDAVIAIDPSVLAAMLAVTGPVTLTDGATIDRADVVEDVLVRPYLDKTPAEQTAIQREVTDGLFARLAASAVDPLRWLRALAAPLAEGRISVWSARTDEQAVLASGPFGGSLARLRAAGADAVGVYFNDATTGKMDTYLHASIAPAVSVCRADGAADVSIAVTLRSSAPAAARTFAVSMTGAANPGAAGDITTDVTVVAPAGWFLGGVRSDGAPVASTAVDSGPMPSLLARATLAPGEERVLTFVFTAKRGTAPTPVIVHTPMLNDVAVSAAAARGC